MGTVIQTSIELPYGSGEKRNVQIYLPKQYEKRRRERFPVLYMHDGQNLFFNELSFAGVSWGVKQTMEAAERKGYEGMIVVGIENAGDFRLQEYSAFPYFDYGDSKTPYGADYVDWIVHELKPQVDRAFRTLSDRDHTFMAGSSAGANISFYAGIARSDIFSRIGLFSTAAWLFDETDLHAFLDQEMTDEDGNLREVFQKSAFFIQTGTEEGGKRRALSQSYIDAALWLDRAFLERGLPSHQIHLLIAQGLTHSERAWRSVFPAFLRFLIAK